MKVGEIQRFSSVSSNRASSSLLAKLFIISLFIPGEFYLNLGGLRLELYRIILMLSVLGNFRYAMNSGSSLHLGDKYINLAILWAIVSILINYGLSKGVEKSGILFIELFGAYYLARRTFTSIDNVISVYKTYMILVVCILPFSFIEFLTGDKWIHDIASAITGNRHIPASLYTEKYMRLGMTRAASAFSHPILNGIVCVTVLPLAFYLYLSEKKFWHICLVAALVVAVITSISSAAFLALAIYIFVISFFKLKKKIGEGMKRIVWLIAALAIVVQMVSNRGLVKLVIQNLTFNPHTGTHRLLIIEHLKDDILRAPFFGSGIGAPWSAPFWMGQSIDNFWWATAFFFGIPFPILVSLSVIYCIKKIPVSIRPNENDYFAYAIISMCLAFLFLGLTVHLFGKAQPLFFFVVGTSAAVLTFLCKEKSIPAADAIEERYPRLLWRRNYDV
ncbi:O-antigen ligase family protein [Microbulbifer mangrovi]|uniref:O-antigen ligase family protein n=1 Tax=Microbulbifer mangrovi TaxID=927787 RepID=UPI00117E88FD|nr:hypothetical protein [Microbulbifer mangrovi]